MSLRNYGFTRKDLRAGSGAGDGVAHEHFDEMVGSCELYIYRHANKKIKGYQPLKLFLESQGCEVIHVTDTPAPVGHGSETIRITSSGDQIPVPSLRRAHDWAHRRNLLHMFHKKG